MNRKADFLLSESIRIDSHNESNRIDSNRELKCSNGDAVQAAAACTEARWSGHTVDRTRCASCSDTRRQSGHITLHCQARLVTIRVDVVKTFF